MIHLPRLMLVTDRRRQGVGPPEDAVAAALSAGPALVQFREKDLSDDALETLVHRLREKTEKEPLIVVNGRAAVARRTSAGLHLPVDQAGLFATRPDCHLLGCSVHTPEEIGAAVLLDPDYLVAGTIFPTPSKPGAKGCGLHGLERLVATASGLPVYAIGGIGPHHVSDVLGAGAYGVAVCGGILGDADPARAARRFLELLGERGTLSV